MNPDDAYRAGMQDAWDGERLNRSFGEDMGDSLLQAEYVAGFKDWHRWELPMMSPAETQRRLRSLAAQARQACDLPARCKVEIGTRCRPVQAASLREACQPASRYPDGDDLLDFQSVDAASRLYDCGSGYLVHLYMSVRRFDGWELEDVCVGWIGNDTEAAQLVDTNGTILPSLKCHLLVDLSDLGSDEAVCDICGRPEDASTCPCILADLGSR